MNRSKRLWVAALSLSLMGISTAGYAALSAATDPHVSFQASGPAGMKIEGTTAELSVADDGANRQIRGEQIGGERAADFSSDSGDGVHGFLQLGGYGPRGCKRMHWMI